MKRLFILTSVIILAAAFSFCSDEYATYNVSTISFSIDGVQKTFKSVTVEQDDNAEEHYTWHEVNTLKNNKDNSNEMVYFELEKGYTGSDSFDGFIYSDNTTAYSMGWDGFTSVTTINTINNVKGSFSGTVKRFNTTTQQNEIHIITNGSFNIIK